MNHKKLLIPAILIFVFGAMAIYVYAATTSCCINPGSGALTCSMTVDVTAAQCCPEPQTSYPSYYDVTIGGPSSVEICKKDFFFQNNKCDDASVLKIKDNCELGCCCKNEDGVMSGNIMARVQCTGADTNFRSGETDCNTACGITQCNNGIDDDKNSCSDWPADSGCTNADDTSESGGSCGGTPGVNCNDPAYTPKITKFTAMPVKGEKQIGLNWENECFSSTTSYYIYRCTGSGCNTFINPIMVLQQKDFEAADKFKFIDKDSKLEFGKSYTYQIKINFVMAKPVSKAATTNLGDLECWHQYGTNNFCIYKGYYDQYSEYMTSHGLSVDTNKLNKAYSCNNENKLTGPSLSCSGNNVCAVVSSGKAQCLDISKSCNYENANPFGLYYTQQVCEVTNPNNKYCFYDRSYTIENSCFKCDLGMSCYDYKSQYSCKTNKCTVGNCEWMPLSIGYGTGVCVDLNKDNCQWCSSPGTVGVETALEDKESWSLVFEGCSEEKADLLAVEGYLCFYGESGGLSCSGVICTNYKTQDECNADKCGLGVCLFDSTDRICKKDGNNDGTPDCTDKTCEEDVYPPDTKIISVIDRGIYKLLLIEITDRTTSAESYKRIAPKGDKTFEGYINYLCKGTIESCSSQTYLSTSSSELIVNGLGLYNGATGEKILDLDEGPTSNTISYYSEDPAGNLGSVKTVDVISYKDQTRPVLFRLDVSNSNIVNNIYYTSDKRPTITANFLDNVIVISASFGKQDNKVDLTPASPVLQKTYVFTLTKDFDDDIYTFELNAKDNKGIFLDRIFTADIAIDIAPPGYVNIIPADGQVVETSQVAISLTFEEGVNINSLTINGMEEKDKFTYTLDKKVYTATIALKDGNQAIVIEVEDFAGNRLTHKSSFIVNADPNLRINITKPSFGVSNAYTFDLVVSTDNDAECRYILDYSLSWDSMDRFDVSGSREHKKQNFDEIPNGDKNVHKLYVECRDKLKGTTKREVFDLSVDTEKPVIQTVSSYPNPIAEEPRTTTLTVNTNKDVICKYDETSQDFNNMQGKFEGFEDNIFRKVNRQEITVDSDGSYKYFVACMSKAELISDTKEITFTSDLSTPLKITSNTEAYSTTNSITLAIQTNKKAQCIYAENPDVSNGNLFGTNLSYEHTTTLTGLNLGAHTYYVKCRDRILQEWSTPLEIKFIIDTTIPKMVYVNDTSQLMDNPEYTWRNDSLRVKWLAEDNESDIAYYNYTLLQSGKKEPIIDWATSFEEDEWISITNDDNDLKLENGKKYYFKVKAKNAAGLVSTEMSSDGITIDTSLKPATCFNDVKDIFESDIDCGGPCEPCVKGKECNENADCVSGFCNATYFCAEASCNDNEQNKNETDIDCGGSCEKCDNNQKCEVNSDCSSGFCSSGLCKETNTCNDEILSLTETDIDCGGACPKKCRIGHSCEIDDDCEANLVCSSKLCSETEPGAGAIPEEKDSDGDGMPDDWELKYGFNPNDSSDAEEDSDGDGLTNLQERSYGTDPLSKDSDGDGANDKKEIDKGTDPLEPEDKPKGILGKLILIVFVVIIVSCLGYGAYYYYSSRKPTEEPIRPRFMPTYIPPRSVQKPPMDKTNIQELVKKRRAEKEIKRQKLFEAFDKESKQEPKKATKEIQEKTYTKKTPSTPEEKPYVSISKGKKKVVAKKLKKEDVFSKLKLISKKEEEKRK